ncbi:MAG TPA: DUF4142 domain-containing protein [Noviherbaspirillum sp.]|nr:DUF4142 domain-containing protein [Noviherbaspirillum sp.]
MAHVNPIQIQKFLKGVDYPASKQALIENAKNLGADENVCASLEQLPDEDFQTPADVSQAFGAMPDETESQAARKGRAQEEETCATGGNEFLAQAIEDSMAEVELCEMALQKSTSDEVKMFAQHMIDEHSQLGAELEKLAGGNKADLPKDMESKHKAAMRKMAQLSGPEFDREFVQHAVKEHENDIKVFDHYAREESDTGIRQIAEKGCRMLEQHLQMARELQKKMPA